jgi:hypothetical protein
LDSGRSAECERCRGEETRQVTYRGVKMTEKERGSNWPF